MIKQDILPKIGVIIVAAGRGARAGGLENGPKQYRSIGSLPVLHHTLARFCAFSDAFEIVVVTHRDDDHFVKPIASNFQDFSVQYVHGGATRQESVLTGLKCLSDQNLSYVLIHDGVRPFVSNGMISRVIGALESGEKAVLPALSVTDTLKRCDEHNYIDQTVSRDFLYAAQTPQGFAFEPIYEAHQRAWENGRNDFTDDCAIAEFAGLKVKIVDGDRENIKLTTKEDIAMADDKLSLGEAKFSAYHDQTSLPDIRTGNGYDIHQLVDGDGVILCGIKIPHTKKLSGHSDADVAFHALTDALLATCGEGDIGDHFPPTDPKWKGVESHVFLSHAVKIISDKGGIITNADISLIAEAPKIGPHRGAMRENLAKVLGIDLERCSVKATTNEKIGCVGREEGIAAIATATVLYGALT